MTVTITWLGFLKLLAVAGVFVWLTVAIWILISERRSSGGFFHFTFGLTGALMWPLFVLYMLLPGRR